MQGMGDAPQKAASSALKRQSRISISESRDQLNDVSEAVKEFLKEISDLDSRKPRLESEVEYSKSFCTDDQIKSFSESEQKSRSASRRREHNTLVINFFLTGEGRNQLLRFWEAVKNGSNVGLTAPLVVILLEIAYEMLTVPQYEATCQNDSEVSQGCYFEDWAKLPHMFYDECLLETVQTIVPPKVAGAELKRSESKVNKSFRGRKKQVYNPPMGPGATLEPTLVNSSDKNVHGKNMDAVLTSKREANSSTSKFSFLKRFPGRRSSSPKVEMSRSEKDSRKTNKSHRSEKSKSRKKSSNPTSPIAANVEDSDSFSEDVLGVKSQTDASKIQNHQFSTTFYDNSPNTNGAVRFPKLSSVSSLSRFESRVQQFSSTFTEKIKQFLAQNNLSDIADVVSFIFNIVQHILSLEFVAFSSATNWRCVIKWCSKKIRKLQSEFSLTSEVPLGQ